MPRDGAIRRGEIVWDQAGRQVPTSVADAAPDAALDLAGRETVVTKKDNDRWIRAPWRACPTQIRAAGVAVSGSLRRAAEHRARPEDFSDAFGGAPRHGTERDPGARGSRALLTMNKGLMCGADACSTGGALLAQKVVPYKKSSAD